MAAYLLACQKSGYPILTWNGMGFDFDVLAEEVQDPGWALEISKMSMHHIDMGFLQLCQMGYMIGLDTAAHGLGLHGKTEGMHGDLAPYLWNGSVPFDDDWTEPTEEQATALLALGVNPGTREAQDLCLEYVAQDVRTTAEVYEALLDQGSVYWTTRRGTQSRYPWQPIQKGEDRDSASMLTVQEALKIREPDTSWMTSPRTRESCMEWIKQYQ